MDSPAAALITGTAEALSDSCPGAGQFEVMQMGEADGPTNAGAEGAAGTIHPKADMGWAENAPETPVANVPAFALGA